MTKRRKRTTTRRTRAAARSSSIPTSVGNSSSKSVVMASIPVAIGAVLPTLANALVNKRGLLRTTSVDNRRYIVCGVSFGLGVALHRRAPTLALGIMAGAVAAAFLPQLTTAALSLDAQLSAPATVAPAQITSGGVPATAVNAPVTTTLV